MSTDLISLSTLTTLSRKIEILANNLANVSTPGFQAERPIFLEHVAKNQKNAPSYVHDYGCMRDMDGGETVRTNNVYDFAIHGKGYFAVQTPQGPAYTRNGHFHLNDSNVLVTSKGYPVLGDSGGGIEINPKSGAIVVSSDGTISNDDGVIGRLAVKNFADPARLNKLGNNLLINDEGQEILSNLDATIVHKAVEASNVDPVREVTEIIEAMRLYQSTSSMTDKDHDRQRKAINKLVGVSA